MTKIPEYIFDKTSCATDGKAKTYTKEIENLCFVGVYYKGERWLVMAFYRV